MRLFPCRSRWGCFWAKSRCRSSRRCKFIRVHRSIHMNTCVSAYASLHVYGAGFVHLCPLVRVELLVVFLRRGGLRQCWGFLHHSSLWRVLRHRGTTSAYLTLYFHPYLRSTHAHIHTHTHTYTHTYTHTHTHTCTHTRTCMHRPQHQPQHRRYV